MATEFEIHLEGEKKQWLEFIDDDMNDLIIETKASDGDVGFIINGDCFFVPKKHIQAVIDHLTKQL